MGKLLKIFTTRNAFSREYGTWLIVLFNMALVPILLNKITFNIIIYFFSVFCFLLFRFELLDFFSIELQFSKKSKLIKGIFYLFLSVFLFLLLIFKGFIEIKLALLIAGAGTGMVILNIITRRRKNQRQNIFAQIILVCFIAFLGALNYFFLTGLFNKELIIIFLFSALYYSNSIIFVRAKTMGPPFDAYALVFSIIVLIFVFVLSCLNIVNALMIIVFIPGLVKTLDNVVLYNFKVPLRRIGINETIHSIIFIILFCLLSQIS